MNTQEKSPMAERELEDGFGRDAVKKEFAKRVHEALLARQWRQADLVRASGIAKDSVSQYYNGRTLPTDLSLVKLAKALNVAPDWLLPSASVAAPIQAEKSPNVFEMLHVAGAPNMQRVRMDKILPFGTANKIFRLVHPDDADGK